MMNQHEPDIRNRTWLQRIFISPDETRLRAGWRLLGQAMLLFITAAILSLLSYLLLFSFDGLSSRADLLLNALAAAVALTASIIVARRYLDRRSVISLGVQVDKYTFPDISVGILISGLMIALIFTLEWAAGWLQVESFAWEGESWLDVIASLAIMLIVFALAGWSEELLARGYWLQNLNDGLNLSLAVLLSSALFALAHAFNSNISWQAYLGLFLSGLFLAFCYLRTHQLWLPIGFHIGWNFFEGIIFGFPVSGEYFYQFIRQTVSGPDIITGGAFGPEGGLILVPVLFLGAGLVFWYTWSRKPGKTSSEVPNE
jgi:membrane protease YdiL (CAAX protease family)